MSEPVKYHDLQVNGPGWNRKTLMLIAAGTILSVLLLLLALWLGVYRLSTDSKEAAIAIAEEKNASAQEVDLANTLRERTVDYVLDQEEIPAYTYAQVQSMDMSVPSGVTVDDLNSPYYTEHFLCARRVILSDVTSISTIPSINTTQNINSSYWRENSQTEPSGNSSFLLQKNANFPFTK